MKASDVDSEDSKNRPDGLELISGEPRVVPLTMLTMPAVEIDLPCEAVRPTFRMGMRIVSIWR